MKFVQLNRNQFNQICDLMRLKAGNKVLQSATMQNGDELLFVAEYQKEKDAVRLYWVNINSYAPQ